MNASHTICGRADGSSSRSRVHRKHNLQGFFVGFSFASASKIALVSMLSTTFVMRATFPTDFCRRVLFMDRERLALRLALGLPVCSSPCPTPLPLFGSTCVAGELNANLVARDGLTPVAAAAGAATASVAGVTTAGGGCGGSSPCMMCDCVGSGTSGMISDEVELPAVASGALGRAGGSCVELFEDID